jgi:hypothetical protein
MVVSQTLLFYDVEILQMVDIEYQDSKMKSVQGVQWLRSQNDVVVRILKQSVECDIVVLQKIFFDEFTLFHFEGMDRVYWICHEISPDGIRTAVNSNSFTLSTTDNISRSTKSPQTDIKEVLFDQLVHFPRKLNSSHVFVLFSNFEN